MIGRQGRCDNCLHPREWHGPACGDSCPPVTFRYHGECSCLEFIEKDIISVESWTDLRAADIQTLAPLDNERTVVYVVTWRDEYTQHYRGGIVRLEALEALARAIFPAVAHV